MGCGTAGTIVPTHGMKILTTYMMVLTLLGVLTVAMASQVDGETAAGRQLHQASIPAAVTPPKGWNWNVFHTHAQVSSFMDDLQKKAPNCVKTFSLGQSRQRRYIRGVQVTDFLTKEQGTFRPAVRLMGAIHGDEIAGAEMLLRFAYHLASLYQKDARVTALLRSTRLYIVPVLNPDGFTARTRENAAGVDLNRNFPQTNAPYAPTTPSMCADANTDALFQWCPANEKGTQPEVLALMRWFKSTPSVLGFNAHGGALVASYPLDACDSRGAVSGCPTSDDPLPKFVAQVYASNSPTMRASITEVGGTGVFDKGTINGAQWYPLLGGLQDWLWWNSYETHLTLELHNEKIPENSFLKGMWPNNVNALMRFTEAASIGIKGIVIDAQTKQLISATVVTLNPKGARKPMPLLSTTGASFYKLLSPGKEYCLRVTAPNHKGVALLAVKLNLNAAAAISGTGLKGLMMTVTVPIAKAGGKKVYKYGGTTACNGF